MKCSPLLRCREVPALYLLLLWNYPCGMVEEGFIKSEYKTKNKCFSPIKEGKNRDSHYKSKTENRQLPPPHLPPLRGEDK